MQIARSSQGGGQIGGLPANRKTKRRRWVSMNAGTPIAYRSSTDYGITSQYVMQYIGCELVNRKVYNIQPVWMNVWQSNTGGVGLTTNSEDTTGLSQLTIDYAYEIPKDNLRTASSYLFAYGSQTVSTTSNLNMGAGTAGDGSPGKIVIPAGGVAYGGVLQARACTFNAGASSTFANRWNFFLRQHIATDGTNQIPSSYQPYSWGAGSCNRQQSSATTLVASVAGTGRFSASQNSDLNIGSGGWSYQPVGFIGEVDDSTDTEPYICVGYIGNSIMRGVTDVRGTDPQTSTTTAWGVAARDAGSWKDYGWMEHWARSVNNVHGVFNLGCSSLSMVAALQSANRRDAYLEMISHCCAVVIDYSANDYVIGQTLGQMQTSVQTLVAELKAAGVYVIVCAGFPYGTSSSGVLRQYNDWAAVRANTGADAVFNPLSAVGDDNTTWWQWKSGYTADNVHPNTTGTNAIYAAWGSFFNSIKSNILR